MDQYKFIGNIGEGAHGLVFKGYHISSGMEVALKKVSIRRLEDGIPKVVLREIKTLQKVDCENVVQLLDVFPHGMGFVLVFDFMPSGLWEMLHDMNFSLTEAQIKTYMSMLLNGVAYLHQQSIMHRDLKPANLLISKDGVLKIADLGLARMYSKFSSEPYSHQVATRWYRSPELLYGARYYSEAVDLWAVGCILAELFNNVPLFPGESDIEQLAIVLRTLGTPSEEQWPAMKDLPDFTKISFPQTTAISWNQLFPNARPEAVSLVQEFLHYDSAKRLSAKQALLHEYFFTPPLPCPMSEMPKPEANHRQKFKMKEFDIHQPIEQLFQDLNGVLTPG